MSETVRELHDRAMEYSDESTLHRRQGKWMDAAYYATMACLNEYNAAQLLPAHAEHEPSRSILYRSAATLALWAQSPSRALEWAKEGLVSVVHSDIKQELLDVITVANKMSPNTHLAYKDYWDLLEIEFEKV